MTKQIINVGATANDRNGDSLRAAFQKVNANFTELYTALGLDNLTLNIGAFEFNGSIMTTTDSTPIIIDQATTVTSHLTVGGDILPSVVNGGDLGSAARPWNSLYVSNNTIYLDNIPLGLDANNNLTVNGLPITGGAAGTNSLQNGSFTVQVNGTGALVYPNVALQRDTGTVQCLGNASTVVYTASASYQHTIRLLIQVEGSPPGQNYDTQSCEMIIAKSFRANDIAATVYGIVHTSAEPLATFTADWNAITSRVEVVCTTPSANTVNVRTFATEITTSD